MKGMMREYGRVILACIFFLIVFLIIPRLSKPLNQSAEGIVETTKEAHAQDSTFYFYIDNIRYKAEKGSTWQDWIESDYNTDGFLIENVCGKEYIVKSNGQYVQRIDG